MEEAREFAVVMTMLSHTSAHPVEKRGPSPTVSSVVQEHEMDPVLQRDERGDSYASKQETCCFE